MTRVCVSTLMLKWVTTMVIRRHDIHSDPDLPIAVLRRLPKWALMEDFPEHVRHEVARILNSEAGRLLSEGDPDAVGALTGSDRCGSDRRPDESSLGTQRKLLPVDPDTDRKGAILRA